FTGSYSGSSLLLRGESTGKESVMPYVINKGEKEPPPQKSAKGSSNKPGPISTKIAIGGLVVAILFALFMFNLYVHPFVSSVKIPHKVAPLPGMADEYPYNTKEWQEAYKQGRTTFLSGVPHMARPAAGETGSPPAGGAGKP